jgi:alkanesulfonate monooxygenase SsuD/methylene tetrahydromethanopterin reductase-like flavin-dependent oxidoreductase (luciferase family)
MMRDLRKSPTGIGRRNARVALSMRFGVYVPSYGPFGDPLVLRDLAVAAEAAAWDGFFMFDVINPLDNQPPPVADPWVTLAAIAQATTWKLALEAGTLDRLSGGRLILGLAAGVPGDYTTFGEPVAQRWSRLDEAAELLHKLLAGGTVEHTGEHYQVSGGSFAPADVPVWASGFWPRRAPVRGARDASGLFVQIRDPGNDFRLPTPAELAPIRADFLASGGSADGEIAIWSPSTEPSAGLAGEYAAAGVTWWFSDGSAVSPDDLRQRIAAGPPRTSPA